MKSRAGTIFSRQEDGVSQKSGDTIFIDEKKQSKNPKRVWADAGKPKNVNSNGDTSKGASKKSQKPHENESAQDGALPNAVELTDAPRSLEDIAVNSGKIIYHIKTMFPFVLFADEIIADEEKVSVIIGRFFQSGYVRSVMLKDISNVSIDTSVMFASITIIDRNFVQDPLVVEYLKKDEALKMRRILMGLIIANSNKVDFSDYSLDEIRDYAGEIGRARDTTTSTTI